jgi:hypothetical protein
LSALDLKPRGPASHITARYSGRKRCVIVELTFDGPREVSNANFKQVSAGHANARAELEWNEESDSSEAHIRYVHQWSTPRDLAGEYAAMQRYAELFLSWLI